MSYANVAAKNAPPPSQQPTPDPALYTTEADATPYTSERDASIKIVPNATPHSSHKRDDFERKVRKRAQDAEEEGYYLWELTKAHILRPGVAGGIVGIINVGLLASASHAFYTQPELRRNTTVISSTVGAALGLLAIEGYAAEKYRETPRGQEEERRARKEGSAIYKHSKEVILRPGVLGGLVGLVNTAILGTVGYYSYINWDKPTWDRRTVSAVSVGLLALWGGEGALAESYRKK